MYTYTRIDSHIQYIHISTHTHTPHMHEYVCICIYLVVNIGFRVINLGFRIYRYDIYKHINILKQY